MIEKYSTIMRALYIAAEDIYKNEVIDTLMAELTIGVNGNYSSKEQWINERIENWIQEVKENDKNVTQHLMKVLG